MTFKHFTLLATAVAFLFAAPSAAHATLIYKGPHEAEARALYDKLPTRGRTDKDPSCLAWELRPGDYVYAHTLGRPGHEFDGLYSPGGEGFVMLGYAQFEPETFVHEFGHFVHMTCFTNAERARWKTFWEANRALFPEYGQKNEFEGFAASYSLTFYPSGREQDARVRDQVRSYFELPDKQVGVIGKATGGRVQGAGAKAPAPVFSVSPFHLGFYLSEHGRIHLGGGLKVTVRF
jgi:hypothetical protein